MSENFNLIEILKDCPEGTKFYSTIFGEVDFMRIGHMGIYWITFKTIDGCLFCVDLAGKYMSEYNGECTIFPSREQRSWSKFTAPWYKKERFDPQTFKPFDRVLVSDDDSDVWNCSIFSHILEDCYPYACVYSRWIRCIPYNDETKHLVGTKEEAPEYYRYWED